MHIQRGGDAMMADEMSPRRLERIGVDHDILERAKALENIIHSSEGYETVEVILGELISKVERLRSLNESLMENGNDLRTRCQKAEARIKELQDLIDKPPEEADWVADYHLLQSALDGPIIDAARKWHAAYRKAQNSNLMRAKEVKRLRSREVAPQRMSQ